jgi:ribonuclease P protein component
MYVRATSVKVGISVSKKIGNSVTRSLVKRRIKESFRLLIPQLTGKYNYVLVARPGIEKTDYTHIAGEIKRLLGKARHISNVESIS